MKPLITLLIPLFLSIGLVGCSSKNQGISEYNKPADYWYEKMLRDIRASDLEGADDKFASLQSEHLNSPLVPEAMLILGRAHMDKREYLLAEFYFEEYLKRFGTLENADFIGYLKLQASFFAFSREALNQQLLLDAIAETEEYIARHPHSRYRPYVDTMLLRLQLANRHLNQEVARIYAIQGKESATQSYKERGDYPWLRSLEVKEPRLPWYRWLLNW